ncbi:MAG TPA: DUF3881 family protein [Pyrinomonadaceae bacterium]|jgi:hypothetical protein
MEIAFNAIGIEIANEAAFNDLTEDVGKRGEASHLARESGTLRARCLKLGAGLEVWSVLYETDSGEIFRADCRPAFRARYAQNISPWVLTEIDREGAAIVHGFVADRETEILFELQNLTEVGTGILERNVLRVGLCGLAYRAEVLKTPEKSFWRAYDEIVLNIAANENDWSLCGKVLAFDALRNHRSGSDLYWIYLDTGEFNLEIMVNRRDLDGDNLQIGDYLKADVWLQGHILSAAPARNSYEGVDLRHSPIDFWKKFKRPN